METRPTTDRIKETLFNMIARGLRNIFLDLFAGSGGNRHRGTEQRCKEAVFVEKNKKRCLRQRKSKLTKLATERDLTKDVLPLCISWRARKYLTMYSWIRRMTESGEQSSCVA